MDVSRNDGYNASSEISFTKEGEGKLTLLIEVHNSDQIKPSGGYLYKLCTLREQEFSLFCVLRNINFS